jgi:hypothetical protein
MIIIENTDKTWRIEDESGAVIADGMNNAQAWRRMDILSMEPTSARQVEKEIQQSESVKAKEESKQEFYSALLTIADNKERKEGWAAYAFKDKFGHWPDDLQRTRGHVHPSVSMFLLKRSMDKKT